MKRENEVHRKVEELTLVWEHEKDNATPSDIGWKLVTIKIDGITLDLVGENFPQHEY